MLFGQDRPIPADRRRWRGSAGGGDPRPRSPARVSVNFTLAQPPWFFLKTLKTNDFLARSRLVLWNGLGNVSEFFTHFHSSFMGIFYKLLIFHD